MTAFKVGSVLWMVAAIWLCWYPSQAMAGETKPLSVKEIAPGIFVHFGVQEDASAANLGAISNIGFIVGNKCVAVVDTGGSFLAGQSLRAAVESITSTPVCYVVNTHVHPDHVFGNAAFKHDGAKFVGHVKLGPALAARGENYLKALRRELGAAAAGSEIIPPDTVVSDVSVLDLGGRTLKLRAWKTAHTDNDLTVYDEKTSTLWTGDLLFAERLPVVDGSLRGWLAAIQELHGVPTVHVVPGHGQVRSWPQALQPEERYLSRLQDDVRSAIRTRLTLRQAVATIGLDERDKWLLFDGYHRRNVTAAFAELEWED